MIELIIACLQEAPSAVPTDNANDSTHDLECSHSERSIDEAIEKSSGTLSPLSPTPMEVGKYRHQKKHGCGSSVARECHSHSALKFNFWISPDG